MLPKLLIDFGVLKRKTPILQITRPPEIRCPGYSVINYQNPSIPSGNNSSRGYDESEPSFSVICSCNISSSTIREDVKKYAFKMYKNYAIQTK